VSFIVPRPESLGHPIDDGHCVRLLQVLGDLPETKLWRRGALAKGGDLARGTAIATFHAEGHYENDTTGRSHAAIFLAETPAGLRVIDQWVGQPVHERLIRFRGGAGKAANDGDRFYVIEVA
jgi:hypothetical protein